MAIAQEDFMVVVKTDDAQTFAREVAEVTRKGYLPVAGQWAHFQDGMHVAYYIDLSKTKRFVPTVEGDHAMPKEESKLGEASPKTVAAQAPPAVAEFQVGGKEYDGTMYA